MAIISFDKDAITEYVPAYGGNRDSDNPCVVRLKFVPYSRVQHYAKILSARVRGITDPARVIEMSQEVQKKQFMENVESISGYSVGDRDVSEPGDFFETADADLVIEVIRAMESQQ